ncbi:hypothetical protein KBY28_21405 [Ruegeria pomeroyi]|uniref:hypothetical protein n=1 Tax=Ruegeria pomeroyi TaxID=89184 RepID=UPI001F2D4CDA|nr:hypothetical protein [Ruegeria pomeroyi]MCE8511011.1 hypothetical protein [Ruegeria pomeroyi]
MSSLRQVIGGSGCCIPCYSIQSIEELLGARDEKKRAELDLQLDAVGARYLETLSDTEGGTPTGHRIMVKNREERGQIYKDNDNFSSVGSFGLGDLLQKLIGGIGSISFQEVSKMAQTDFERLLDFDVSEFPPELAAMITSAAEAMKEQFRKVGSGPIDLLEAAAAG